MTRDVDLGADRPAEDAGEIEITPEMIKAGAEELIFDAELIRTEVVESILTAALVAAGFRVNLDRLC
jgi:hypothetical protein